MQLHLHKKYIELDETNVRIAGLDELAILSGSVHQIRDLSILYTNQDKLNQIRLNITEFSLRRK